MRIFLCLLLLVPWVSAQGNALETLRGAHEKAMTGLSDPLDQWTAKYHKQLKILSTRAQDAGDLDQVLVIRQELDGGVAEIDAKYTALKRARTVYDKRREQLEKVLAARQKALLTDYQRKLKALQVQLTRDRKIEEAVQVREEVAAVEVAIQAAASGRPTIGVPGTGGNSRPGRLVLFGKRADENEDMLLPEAERNRPFVRVHAWHDQYYAVDAEGRMIGQANNHNDHVVPKGLKPVTGVAMGRHMSVMWHADGTMSHTPNEHNAKTMPELDDVIKVSAGYNYYGALRRNGTLVPFGYNINREGFNNPRLLTDVSDFGVGDRWYFVKKRDGTFIAGKNDGEMWEAPRGLADADVVDIVPSSSGGCIFRTREGKLILWRLHPAPKDMGPVVQVRTGHDVYAAQREDGTWWAWGPTDYAAVVNAELERLGPLKDLAIGRRFFIGIK